MFNIKYTAIATLVLICSILVGCGEDKLRTGSYYKENPDAMKKILEKCKAERDKGYKPEGNFGENCSTARNTKMQMTRTAIRNNFG